MVVHRDDSSVWSRCTDTLSNLSKVFGFDHELFTTKVYESVFRNTIKATMRGVEHIHNRSTNPEELKVNMMMDHRQHQNPRGMKLQSRAKEKSRAIERNLAEEAIGIRATPKVALLGQNPHLNNMLVQQLETVFNAKHGEADMKGKRFNIYHDIVDCAKRLVRSMDDLSILPEGMNAKNYELIKNYETLGQGDFDVQLCDAIQELWEDSCIAEVIHRELTKPQGQESYLYRAVQ